MFFEIYVCFIVICLVLVVSGALYDWFLIIPGILTLLVISIPVIAVCSSHASNLGTIKAQHNIVTVYEERIAKLEEGLNSFDYPKGSLLNADSPVASIVKAIADSELQLAKAKEEKAQAIVEIEQRRAGLFSGIIRWMGDYKNELK